MSYTFICTPEKNWYLKIDSIEQLLDYWNCVFTPKMKKALDTLDETKEFGRDPVRHADILQSLIGFTSRGESISYKDAYSQILCDSKVKQYQALCNGKTIYVNKNMGWNVEYKKVEQFVHKNNFEFPVMQRERLNIEKFPMGIHFYVFIDGVQLRKDDNLKFDSYDEAFEYAQKYLA